MLGAKAAHLVPPRPRDGPPDAEVQCRQLQWTQLPARYRAVTGVSTSDSQLRARVRSVLNSPT
jgi:hypothetical protein